MSGRPELWYPPSMRTLPVVSGFLLVFGLGCAIGKDKDGKGLAQDPACADYLDCVTATEPSTVGALLETYGEDGTCWESQSAADACADACVAALSAAHQVDPDEPACDDGSELNSLALLGAGAAWSFDMDDHEMDCDFSVGLLDIDGAINGSDSAAFEFDAELEAYSLFEGRVQVPTTLTCTLDGQDFTCDASVFEEVDLDGDVYENVLELSGTFGSTYESADLVAFVYMNHVGERICEATTTLSGTRD